ncbi:MAG: zinc-binding dehydrogenase [Armatimonadetes bacterium]|nr:zinc-binding dehydrogenase [Armatimonadota bacterium]
MLAAVVEGPGQLVVREMPEPRPGPYEALCELVYGASCTGTDTHIIDGGFPYLSPLPTVFGHESVGRVVELGAKVRHLRVGDLVTRVGTPAAPEVGLSVTWGGFAEYGLARDWWAMAADGLPAEQWMGHRVNQVVPHGIDERVAPMFTTWRETLSYLTRLGFAAGQSILVVGSGGNGLSYAAHARNVGAATVAMVGSAALAEPAQALAGVDTYLDYRREDLGAALAAALPGGVDIIIDAVGRRSVADAVLPVLKPGGKYATYGIDDLGQIRLDPTRARGAFTVYGGGNYDEAETHQRVSEFVLCGKLDARLWYDVEAAWPLARIGEAFDAVRARRTVKALVRLKR